MAQEPASNWLNSAKLCCATAEKALPGRPFMLMPSPWANRRRYWSRHCGTNRAPVPILPGGVTLQPLILDTNISESMGNI